MTAKIEQRRELWVILTIVFLGFLGISMPYLIFPALFLNPAYSILSSGWSEVSPGILLGVTLAAYPLGQFIGSPILGALSDDYGRKPLLVATLFGNAMCSFASGIAITLQSLELLVLSRFLAGLMEGNIAIARAMAADLKSISKHETFGKINAAASIAYLLGPLLGGLLSDASLFAALSAATPFYCVCFIFFGLATLSTVVLKKAATKVVEARSFWQRINLVRRVSLLFSNRRLRFLLITSTAFTLATDIFYEFGPVYLTVKWALGPAQLIVYNAVLCLGLFAGTGWLTRIFSSRSAIIYSTAAFALLLVAMALTDSPYLMLGLFATSGLVIGLAITLITVKISDSAPDTIQGEVMGVQVSLRVLADATICLLGGVLLMLSSRIILIVAAAICLGAMQYYSRKADPGPTKAP